MIESCIVIVFLCLLFLGLFQLIHAYVARDVLYHAAARAARAKTVGFNRWMVEKTMRVAAIPNAGSLTQPALSTTDQALANALATRKKPGALWDFALRSTPQSPTIGVELARIPDYLASGDAGSADAILDYKDWGTLSYTIASSSGIAIDPASAGTITAQVQQPYDWLIAWDALQAGSLGSPSQDPGKITLGASYTIEANYPLYLDDNGW